MDSIRLPTAGALYLFHLTNCKIDPFVSLSSNRVSVSFNTEPSIGQSDRSFSGIPMDPKSYSLIAILE